MPATPASTPMFDAIASFAALLAACQRAARGKRGVPGAAAFLASKERHLLRMADALQAGTWQPGPYKVLQVTEPKPRTVSAAPFADRVVHQALCAQIAPVFERGFIADSFANRVGHGTHRAVARYEHCRDRFSHVLRCDIYRYFPAIDHAVLKADLRRRLHCPRTLALCDTIIDGSNPQEPVLLYYPGDDLFTPHERRRGLPIGNLTSQLFGNVYLNPVNSLRDRWLAGTVGMAEVQQRVDAWLAHAAHANTWRLQQDLFQGKRFDPVKRLSRAQALQTWKTTGRAVQHNADVAE